MSQQPLSRVQALFDAVIELAPAQREEWLERACADQPELLAQVRKVLEFDAELHGATGQIASGLARLLAGSTPEASLRGMRVGPYELHDELGHGGMGVVYRAERVDGTVRQQVAIKFVRRELLDAEALYPRGEARRRFLLERQTLAAMDHPNIARLLDAAALADGSPYYVMEYVAGVPITEFCDRAKLGIRERVALFRVVCSAVAHAHRNLIVHRDLKPGNILVTTDGVPKLLDFGIAKPLLTGDATDHAQTGTALRYFSPLYAAPEQLTGAPIGVGCDVYALGLLLYELLVGTRPFNFTDLSAGQIERLVTTVPPPVPSTAAAQADSTGVTSKQLRGDLDGIVLQCLRKLPAERYASVEQLEADLRSYLEGLPVQARGGHAWYRARKFLRRHAAAVSAGALLTVSLIAGILAFAWQARIAEQRAAELEQVANFQAEMLAQVNPAQAGQLLSKGVLAKFEAVLAKSGSPHASTEAAEFARQWQRINSTDVARELIDQTMLAPAASTISEKFKHQPLVSATLSQALTDLYVSLALYDAAAPLQAQALEIRRTELGESHPETLFSSGRMGELLLYQGKLDEAVASLRQTVDASRRTLGSEHPRTLRSISTLGVVLYNQSKVAEAEPYYLEALETRRRLFGVDNRETLSSMVNLSNLRQVQGNFAEAESLLRAALDGRERLQGEEDPETIVTIGNLASVLFNRGALTEAEAYCRRALALHRRVSGEENPNTLLAYANLGAVLRQQGKLSEAEPLLRQALELRRRTLGDEDPLTTISVKALGALLVDQGKLAEGEAYQREALTVSRRTLGNEHRDTLNAIGLLGSVLERRGNLAEAEQLHAEALETRLRVFGAEHPDTLKAIANLASVRVGQGRFAEAESALTPIEAQFRAAFGSGANLKRVSGFLMVLGKARTGLEQFAEAEGNLLEAQSILAASQFPVPREVRERLEALVDLYARWNENAPDPDIARKHREWTRRLEEAPRVPENV